MRIGLALGSGSWAHIGAIRALEERGIRADRVCGTSIGALVGPRLRLRRARRPGELGHGLYSGRELWLPHGNLLDAVRASCALPGLSRR